MVEEGLTVTGFPGRFPGFQTYDTAPEAVSVELWPGQMVAGDADAVTVGVGTTMMLMVRVPLQPAPVEPMAV